MMSALNVDSSAMKTPVNHEFKIVEESIALDKPASNVDARILLAVLLCDNEIWCTTVYRGEGHNSFF